MKYSKGNLLEAPVEALVNTVNTVGVMGKGIALQFKEAFPSNYSAYQKACKDKWLQPGKLLVFREQTINGEKIIINFPTKTEWFQKSKYEYIESGLKELVEVIEREKIKSIAIPPLGCGNGGLKWETVKAMIEKYLKPLNEVNIIVYEPSEKVKALLKAKDSKKETKLTPARAMLLYAMYYYESLGETSSLFVANKLAYFFKRMGEANFNRLKFKASHYGPYSVQLAHMLHQMNGEYLKGLEQMDVKAFEPIELQYNKVQEVSDYIKRELTPENKTRLRNLLGLIDGYQSALSLEVLATVDFVKHEYKLKSEEQIVNRIHAWSDRKKNLMNSRHILKAIKHLDDYNSKSPFA